MNNEEKILALITEMKSDMADMKANMATKTDLADMRAEFDEKLSQQKTDIMQGVQVIIENTVTPRFNLLAEGIQDIREQLIPRSRFDELDEEVKFLKAAFRLMSEEVQALKKAR